LYEKAFLKAVIFSKPSKEFFNFLKFYEKAFIKIILIFFKKTKNIHFFQISRFCDNFNRNFV